LEAKDADIQAALRGVGAPHISEESVRLETARGNMRKARGKSKGKGYRTLNTEDRPGLTDAPAEPIKASAETAAWAQDSDGESSSDVGSSWVVMTPHHSRHASQSTEDRRVTFDLASTIIYEITPYSEVYGVHPRTFNFDKNEEPPSWCFMAPPDTTPDSDSEEDESSDDDEEEQPYIARNGRCSLAKFSTALVQQQLENHQAFDVETDDEQSTEDTLNSGEGSLDGLSDDDDDEDAQNTGSHDAYEWVSNGLFATLSAAFAEPEEMPSNLRIAGEESPKMSASAFPSPPRHARRNSERFVILQTDGI